MPSSHHFILSDREYRACPYTPANIQTTRLFFSGLGMSFGEDCETLLFENEKSAFKEFFVFREVDKELTDPWIIQDSTPYQTSAKSFLLENHYEFGSMLGGDDFAQWLKPETMLDLIHELKEKIRGNPQDVQSWLNFSICYQAGLLPDHALPVLEKAPDIDFYTLFKNEEKLAAVVLRYLAESILLSGDTELLKNYKGHLIDATKKLADEYVGPFSTSADTESWGEEIAIYLCDVFIILDRKDTLSEALKALSQTVIELCEIWPSLAPIWRKMFNSLIKDIGFKESALPWQTLYKLRTMN